MKAVVHFNKKELEGLSDITEINPGMGEVRVKLKKVGLNHRDLFVLHHLLAHKRLKNLLIL